MNKSSSIEYLNSTMLKKAFIILLTQLTHLFNCSLGTSIFPDAWKLGKVIPIPKTKVMKYVTNWRPISLLSLPGKLLEKIVHKQLVWHLRYNNLLSEQQHGFVSRKSTSTAIQDFMYYVTNQINKYNICSGIFIDLSKAFDSLNHSILLHKLQNYGIRGSSASWFTSYLDSRQQKTLFNGKESSFSPVLHGVPQGSTLGPLLYILYVNDYLDRVSNLDSNVIMYADDTVLLSHGTCVTDVISENQKLFDDYVQWSTMNLLKINVMKRKQMIVCPRSKNVLSDSNIVKDGVAVQNTDIYTYLGVEIDKNLSFEPFLKSVIKKVNYKLYLFSKIRYLLTFNAAILVYKQMVLPFFDYLDILTDSGPKKYIDKLQCLQFRGIKIIYQYCIDGRKIKNRDEACLHGELGLSYLKCRRNKHILHMMFALKSRRPDLLDSRDKKIVLRSNLNIRFKEDKSNYEVCTKSPYVRGCTLWNKLPAHIQSVITRKEFDILLTPEILAGL